MHKNKGFTLVEIIVIISVIAILVTVVIVSVGNWRKSTAETEVKSDLRSLSGAMEAARNFNNGYPTSIPSTFTSSDNVTVTYDSGNSANYCVDAVSTADSTVKYHIDTAATGREPQAGIC
ncbi:MAG TPA: prepilin-type N-terminal cleavage/methylation domain-containing protein [Candidatus Saccharimonadales bacterium]|nr:prepilin-type N-terminal cleavage/methylation domain-containing protein [Candidatus Saccharimonadales bacterium]